jgi:adenylate cyclase class 2
MANEVEIKFIVHDLEALRQKLRDSGFRELTPRTHEMNTLYDTPSQDLRSHGKLLRLRLYGERWILTHKSPSTNSAVVIPRTLSVAKGTRNPYSHDNASDQKPRHKSRTELETPITNGSQMDAILRALGYAPSFRYEKFRAEWTDGIGHVVLDETPIGNLAEIEGPPDWIDRTAYRLGVSESDYITSNYAALFFEWKARTGSAAEEMTFEAITRNK